MNSKPIGVFDSGIGGLTVVKEIKKLLPNEEIIYLGDTARVPYGTRSKDTIIRFSYENAKFLIRKNIKCLVIACHTSSAYAYGYLKNKVDIPIFDVITPVIGYLVNQKIKSIGVIATKATISSHIYRKYLKKINSSFGVYEKACPLFVPVIEEGEINGELINILVKRYLLEIKKRNIEALVMGCTHYPLIKSVIKKEIGCNVELINPGNKLAKNLKQYLYKTDNLRTKISNDKYYLTDITESFLRIFPIFLGKELKNIQKVNLSS